jgi:hypothetical protein
MTFWDANQGFPKSQSQLNSCPSGFTCKFLPKNSCRSSHQEGDWALSKDYQGLLHMIAKGYTIAAYVTSSEEESEEPIYSLSLYSYPKLPVHTSESEQLQLRAHYLYSVTVKEYIGGSLEIVNVKELGRLGQADTEVPLINENLPQLFDYHLEMTERVQTLIDNKKYIRGQFVVREGSGEYVV